MYELADKPKTKKNITKKNKKKTIHQLCPGGGNVRVATHQERGGEEEEEEGEEEEAESEEAEAEAEAQSSNKKKQKKEGSKEGREVSGEQVEMYDSEEEDEIFDSDEEEEEEDALRERMRRQEEEALRHYFDTLHVLDLNKAYKKKIKEYHPDKKRNHGNNRNHALKMTQIITEANRSVIKQVTVCQAVVRGFLQRKLLTNMRDATILHQQRLREEEEEKDTPSEEVDVVGGEEEEAEQKDVFGGSPDHTEETVHDTCCDDEAGHEGVDAGQPTTTTSAQQPNKEDKNLGAGTKKWQPRVKCLRLKRGRKKFRIRLTRIMRMPADMRHNFRAEARQATKYIIASLKGRYKTAAEMAYKLAKEVRQGVINTVEDYLKLPESVEAGITREIVSQYIQYCGLLMVYKKDLAAKGPQKVDGVAQEQGDAMDEQTSDCTKEWVHIYGHESEGEGEGEWEEGELRADMVGWTSAGGGILEEVLAGRVQESKPDCRSFDLRGGAAGSQQVGPHYI